MQLDVTKKSGKITAVSGTVTTSYNQNDTAYLKSTLIQLALSANGSSFGNIGGATYTSRAFKQALDEALAKF
ncbi:MAG: FMN-binding protein [Micrococcales bacterium]